MSNYVKIPDWDHEAIKSERDKLRVALLAIQERLNSEYDVCRCTNQTKCSLCLSAECWCIADAALKGGVK